MTIAEIKSKIKATIDQYYHFPNKDYIQRNQLHFIGGVLQVALHLLDFDNYNDIKMYIYNQYGYDCGGCTDGQLSFEEIGIGGRNDRSTD